MKMFVFATFPSCSHLAIVLLRTISLLIANDFLESKRQIIFVKVMLKLNMSITSLKQLSPNALGCPNRFNSVKREFDPFSRLQNNLSQFFFFPLLKAMAMAFAPSLLILLLDRSSTSTVSFTSKPEAINFKEHETLQNKTLLFFFPFQPWHPPRPTSISEDGQS